MYNNHSCRTYTVKQLLFFAFRTTGQFDKDTWLLRDNSAKSLGISSDFVSSGSNVASINITMKGPETSENTATPQNTRVTNLDYSRKFLKTNNGLQPKRIRSQSQLVKISVTQNVNSLQSTSTQRGKD